MRTPKLALMSLTRIHTFFGGSFSNSSLTPGSDFAAPKYLYPPPLPVTESCSSFPSLSVTCGRRVYRVQGRKSRTTG